MASDPLEGLERRPQTAQLAILATVARQQNNALARIQEDLRTVKTALWGLLAGLALSAIGIVITLLLTRHP